jgi:ketosteroid isomerase-like protein
MSYSAQQILTDIYDAWRMQNLELLATYLPDDFSHFINVPVEMHPLGEVRHGKSAVLERFAFLFGEFEMQRLDTGRFTANAHSAAVQVRKQCRHRESGAVFDMTKTDLWTLEDGWPVKLFEHYDLGRFKAFLESACRR